MVLAENIKEENESQLMEYARRMRRERDAAHEEIATLREFVDACSEVGSGKTPDDPIRVEGPADGRWSAVKP